MLEVRKGEFGYKNRGETKSLIKGFDFTLERGQLICLLGANGIGKTTFFRTLLGGIPLLGGEILIDGVSAQSMSR